MHKRRRWRTKRQKIWSISNLWDDLFVCLLVAILSSFSTIYFTFVCTRLIMNVTFFFFYFFLFIATIAPNRLLNFILLAVMNYLKDKNICIYIYIMRNFPFSLLCVCVCFLNWNRTDYVDIPREDTTAGPRRRGPRSETKIFTRN